jgi:hypothetical protein
MPRFRNAAVFDGLGMLVTLSVDDPLRSDSDHALIVDTSPVRLRVWVFRRPLDHAD